MTTPCPTREALLPTLRSALDFAAAQARRALGLALPHAPMYTVGGRWNREGERWTHWCEGFFPGVLWLLYRHTKDESWRAPAEKLSRALEPRRHDRAVHDLVTTVHRQDHAAPGTARRENERAGCGVPPGPQE